MDTDSMEFEVLDNPNVSAAGGAGIQTGQMIANAGVKAVITGNIGPNAFKVLDAAGIKVCTGATGTVKEAVEDYKAGKLSSSSSPNVEEYFGTGGRGGGGGMGGGMGGGRGGGGMGRGRGGGGGRGR